MPKGIPFAPPIGPALPISWVSLAVATPVINNDGSGMQVTLDGDVVKQGMTPPVAYYTWADDTIRNTEEP